MKQTNENNHYVGFDLGGTKMLATVFNAQFEVLGQKRIKTRAREGVKSGIERICQAIEKAVDNAKISPEQLAGIGVGCPGPLNLDRGIILNTPNMGWKNVKIKEILEEAFSCPAVILNDVDAGVYGEYRFGAAKGSRCAVGVFPGTGIGGGCVYEGRIIRGLKGSCMEIGHVQVMPDGPICGCGRRGCLEAVASRLAISSAAAKAAFQGQAPHLLENAGTDLTKIRSGALAASIKAGDAVVEQIVRNAARQIGVAVATAVHLLAPETVVLGGGLVEAMPELFVEEVGESARNRVMPSFETQFEVVAAELDDDAVVMGAAAWARDSQQAAAEDN